MPLILVLVALTAAAVVGLSGYEAAVEGPDASDVLLVLLGLGVLVGAAARRPWLQPLAQTLAGVLLLVGLFGLLFWVAPRYVNSRGSGPDSEFGSLLAALRLALGALLLACSRHRDLARVLAERAALRLR